MDARAAERVLKAERMAREAAKAPVPTTAQIRRKMRRQEGMHADLRNTRPVSADAIGLTEVEEFEQLRGAAVAARLRPGTADGVSTTKHHRMKETKGSKFHSKQGGFIPAGRDFGLSALNPGRGKRRRKMNTSERRRTFRLLLPRRNPRRDIPRDIRRLNTKNKDNFPR